ncbi:unnamed protein product, partial [Effrenium voratum]
GHLELSGNTSSVQAAQRLLAERVRYVAFEVPRDAASTVLGERGQARQELESCTGAHLWVELGDPSVVQIAGSATAVDQAVAALDLRVTQERFDCPPFAERRAREVVRSLRELLAAEGRSGECRVQVERLQDKSSIKLVGNRDVVAKARALVEAQVAFEELPLTKAQALRLVQAAQLKLLRQSTGASIEVSVAPPLLRLAGSCEALLSAKAQLSAVAGGAKDPAKDAAPSKPQPKAEAVSMDMEAQPKASPKAGRPGRVLIDGIDVLRFRNTPASESEGAALSWEQLYTAAKYFAAKEYDLRIFLQPEVLLATPALMADFRTALTRAEEPRALIVSAAEVLKESGVACLIVSNAGWLRQHQVGYTFLDVNTFVPAWAKKDANATSSSTGFIHKRSMFVGGVIEKKERCVDCTRPIWDGHESMKCVRCRSSDAGSQPKTNDVAKRMILSLTGVPVRKDRPASVESKESNCKEGENSSQRTTEVIEVKDKKEKDKKEKKEKKQKKLAKKVKKEKKHKKKGKEDSSSS